MSYSVANDISKRLGTFDRFMNNNGSTLNSLFKKGLGIE